MTLRALLPALLAAGLLLAGCGGSSPSTQTHIAAAAANSGVAFANCMRANGVTKFPDPSANNGGGIQISANQTNGSGQTMTVNGVPVSAPAFQHAMQVCEKYAPHGGAPSAATSQRMRAAALAMSKCMRSHGVPNFPDPVFGAGPGGGVSVKITSQGGGLNPTSPAFQAASRICMPVMRRKIAGTAQVPLG